MDCPPHWPTRVQLVLCVLSRELSDYMISLCIWPRQRRGSYDRARFHRLTHCNELSCLSWVVYYCYKQTQQTYTRRYLRSKTKKKTECTFSRESSSSKPRTIQNQITLEKKRIPLKICVLPCFVWIGGTLFNLLCVLRSCFRQSTLFQMFFQRYLNLRRQP